MAFTKRDEEILIIIADKFYEKEQLISEEWLEVMGISRREYKELAKTMGVALRGYALLPSPIRKKVLDVGVLHKIGRPMTDKQITGSFISASTTAELFPNCRIANCSCDSKGGEWKKDCICMCHMDQAQKILGTTEFDSEKFMKLAGSDKRV